MVKVVPGTAPPAPPLRRYSRRQRNNGEDLEGKTAAGFADVVSAARVLEVAKALRADEGGKYHRDEPGSAGRWTINPETNNVALRWHGLVVALAMVYTALVTPYAIGFETSLPGTLFVFDVVVNIVFVAVRGCHGAHLHETHAWPPAAIRDSRTPPPPLL